MDIRQLFHGADGDKILGILARREILPSAAGEIFFSERRPDSVFMHGADMRRRASFAVRLQVSIPPGAPQVRKSTPGVLDTLVVKTTRPLATAVLELYVRTLHGGEGNVQRVIGEADIRRFLGS